MALTPVLIFHICAGAGGLIFGVLALIFAKGSKPHRFAGNAFFASMLAMSGSGFYIAVTEPAKLSIIAALLTFYLVVTGWLAVIRQPQRNSLIAYGAVLFALATAATAIGFGLQAKGSATPMNFVFASIALLGVAFDVRVIIKGSITGRYRIARHLWRMCTALLLASLAFFLGQQQVFPAVMRHPYFLVIPPLIIVGTLFFWLFRVRFTKASTSVTEQALATPNA